MGNLPKGIGTIAISFAITIVAEILVVKGVITQANANLWLIGAVALLFLGIYLVIRGTVFKPKPTTSISPTGNQLDITQDATKFQLDHAKALSDDYFQTRRANRIIRFVFLGVGLGLIVWGAIGSDRSGAFIAGILVVLYGMMFFA